jgi:Aspartyl protease
MAQPLDDDRSTKRIAQVFFGWFFLVIVLSIITTSPGTAAGDPLTVLIARARNALNYGRANTRSLYVSGTIDIGGLSGTYQSWTDMSDGSYSQSVDAGPFSGSSGYDGTSVWKDDVSGVVFRQDAPQAIAAATNERFVMTNSIFAPNYAGAEISYLGSRIDGGQSYEAISVKPVGGYPTEWWFNAATALPERRIATIMGRTTTSVLGDYRKVGGWIIPFSRIDTTDNDYSVTTLVTNTVANPPDLNQRLRIPQSHVNDYSLTGAEVRVPMQFFKNQIFVDVLINGKGPFHLLFDSGGFNLIDPTVAYQVGGQVIASLHALSGLGTAVRQVQYIKVATVSLGGAAISNQYFSVAELGPRTNYVPFYEKSWQEMQGLIGYEFLARYQVTVDYAHSQLILRMPQSSAQGNSLGAATKALFADRHVFVSCSLAGVPSTCLLDTGSSFGALVNKPFVDAHPQVLPRWYTGSGYIGGVNGRSRVSFGQLSSLALGPDSVTDVDAAFGVEDKGGLANPFIGALIGNSALKRFTVTFDYPDATVYLSSNPASAP